MVRIFRELVISLLAAGLLAVGFLLGDSKVGKRQLLGDDAITGTSPTGYWLTTILLEPDVTERAEQLLGFFDVVDPDQALVIRGTYDRMFPFVDPVAVTLFADWWAGVDPQAALANFPKGFARDPEVGLSTALRRWAREDPKGAMEHMTAKGARYPRDVSLAPFVRGWMESGDDSLWHYVEELPSGPLRLQILEVIADEMVFQRGPDATMRIAEALPDDALDRLKLQFFRRVAAALALREPAKAREWAERYRGSEFGEGLMRHVVGRWAAREPAAALSWLGGLSPDKEQAEATSLAYGMWIQRNRDSAMAWMAELGVRPSLEPAWSMYAVEVSREDPLAGIALLSDVEDSERRERELGRIVMLWMRRDEAAARAWLEESELSVEMKEQIRDASTPRRARKPSGG
ncbi:MAG: hypothetical protein AAEJ53_09470 [Myxococcota bacterium]